MLDAVEEVTARAVLSWAVKELCWAVCTSVRPAGQSVSSAANKGYAPGYTTVALACAQHADVKSL